MEMPREQLDLRDDPNVISPPIVAPAYGCAKAINVTGYIRDALIDVEVDALVITGVPGGSPVPFGIMVGLPAELVPGQTVRARQSFGGAVSIWSAPVVVRDHTLDYPAGPPRPEIFPTPLNDCGVRTGVGNLLVGCKVWITANGAIVGSVDGGNNPQGINVAPPHVTAQKVVAWASLCADPSPPSVEHAVQPAPQPLGTPGFEPIFSGGQDLVVNAIANGAKFTLSRNGVGVGTFACWGGRCHVALASPFSAGETFSATQELCPADGPSPPGIAVVEPCSALPAPQVAPVQDGDTQIVFTAFVPGSQIKVFVNQVKTGDGSGPVVSLTTPVPPHAVIHVWQVLGSCEGQTVQELVAKCVAPPVASDPSAVNLFPVGTHEYDAGGVDIDGFHYNIRGSIYYPAEVDGTDQSFNARLASLGPVPVIVLVHGAHSATAPSYQGYDYFQQALARMGFVVASVDERETDRAADWPGWTSNIVRRAELAIASISFLQGLNASGPLLQGKLDLSRLGLMGHSRGGDCVLAVTERLTLPGVSVGAVLSLAPVNSGAHSGRPGRFPFMTFLPAADGDVIDNNGAQFYDQSRGPLRTQLYIEGANHNYFNRQWANDDSLGTLPLMSRYEHERILLSYGAALFRWALRGEATREYLLGSALPAGVHNANIRLAFGLGDRRVIDDYENPSIGVDTEGAPTAQLNGLVANELPFSQSVGAFNQSFFGNSTGNVCVSTEPSGDFRSELASPVDLNRAAVWLRAAEVVDPQGRPASPTGFRMGIEDGAGTIGWVDVDDVGGLARPFDRTALDAVLPFGDKRKTMLNSFRFPGRCFADNQPRLNLNDIRAIHFNLDRVGGRPIAFDDLEIIS